MTANLANDYSEILNSAFREVHQDSELVAAGFEIRQQLRSVMGSKSLKRLDFYDNLVFNNQVEAVKADLLPFVHNLNPGFGFDSKPSVR